jgi:NADH dehydrogenase
MTEPHRGSNICVVGGGFGGLFTALRIAKRLKRGSQLYLIDPKDRFVFLPLLYDLLVSAASVSEIAPRFCDILIGSKINFIQGAVTDIDFEQKKCFVIEHFEGGKILKRTLSYEQLVLAPGNQPILTQIPGAVNHAVSFSSLDDCLRLQSKIQNLKRNPSIARIVIVGAGFSGVELAANLADFFGLHHACIHLLTRGKSILVSSTNYNRSEAEKELIRKGVHVKSDCEIERIEATSVCYKGGTGSQHVLDADLIILSTGSEPSHLLKELSIRKDLSGKVRVRDSLQVLHYDDVFCIGDCIVMENRRLDCNAQAALQQADVAVHNVLELHNRKVGAEPMLRNFRFFSLGEIVSLGLFSATLSGFSEYVQMHGILVAFARRIVYAWRMPTIYQAVYALGMWAITVCQLIWR